MKAAIYIITGIVAWTLISIAFAGAVVALATIFEALKPALGIAATIAVCALFYHTAR